MYKSIPWVAPSDISVAHHYPERADREEPWYDRIAEVVLERTVKPLQRRNRERKVKLGAIVRASAVHVRAFRKLDDDALRAHVPVLRGRLVREGMTLALVGEVFALIREVTRRVMEPRVEAGRTIPVMHYAVQLMGAYSLLQGRLVEMATGEGKTLTAALAAATAALARIPTHVVTVNDYLARRDAEEMGPIYRFVGLTVGCIDDKTETLERQRNYSCDITYCSNSQLAFDYLRDQHSGRNIQGGVRGQIERLSRVRATFSSPLVLNGLHFAIVDEADSIFVDEARTPLILSSTPDGPVDPTPYRTALDLAGQLLERRDFTLDRQRSQAELLRAGGSRLHSLAEPLADMWQLDGVREDRVRQALCAIHLYQRDKHYLVHEDKIVLVAEGTGRMLDSHAWEGGLHQMVECKEGVTVTAPRETLARLTYQRLFRRYILLAGMTGTAKEVAPEVREVYGLDVVRIPLKRRLRRSYQRATLCLSKEEKWDAVAEATRRTAMEEKRPVLVGTRTVKDSEDLTECFARRGIPHTLLNAKNDKEEAEIVSHAGEAARITIATNMAGRGTDIRLGEGVAERGGLHVILTECHESRRIDRQLFGRAARQGDPGSCEMIVSLEDELFRTNAEPARVFVKRLMRSKRLHSTVLTAMLRSTAQFVAERRNARIRRQTFKHDRQLDRFMAFAGTRK